MAKALKTTKQGYLAICQAITALKYAKRDTKTEKTEAEIYWIGEALEHLKQARNAAGSALCECDDAPEGSFTIVHQDGSTEI